MVQRRDYRQGGGTMATWEELGPGDVARSQRYHLSPEWEPTEGRNNAKRGGTVPRGDKDMSIRGGSFPVGEGLYLEEAWPSSLKACPHPQGGA